jgi:uncharacterized membrane protein
MDIFYKTLLYTHIISGGIALVCGSIAMLTKKGQKAHRTSGKIFFYSMLLVCFSAIGIAIFKDLSFLLMVGIFALFQNYFGLRAIKNKQLRYDTIDIVMLLTACINSIFMLISIKPVLMVFGIISAFLCFGQIKIYVATLKKTEIPKSLWLRQHIGMMMGAYIATLTAFLVVNVKNVEPGWLIWLAPTAILVPLMLYWTKKYVKINT